MTRAVAVLIAAWVFASGCTATHATRGTAPLSLLIVGLSPDAAVRAKFEDTLAVKLAAGGLLAASSHGEIPDLVRSSREAVIQLATRIGATGVVVVNPMSVDGDGHIVSRSPVPVPNHAQLDALLQSAISFAGPTEGRVALVTNVYQLSSGRLLWGGVSWTFDLDDVSQVIEEMSTVIADNIIAADRQLQRLRAKGIDPLAAREAYNPSRST